MKEARESKRYLGLELSGAKNQKTALAVLEHFPKEKKTFLLEAYERVVPRTDQTGDEALLELLGDLQPGVTLMGINVPLTLPPCIHCTKKVCPLPRKCTVPEVKWMRQVNSRAKGLEFTPYTQRPVELWVRHQVLPHLEETYGTVKFEIDETLGGSKAPLTARMQFLSRHLKSFSPIEVWPKLTVAMLAMNAQLPKRVLSQYRHLDTGVQGREQLLTMLVEHMGLFIYERDAKKLTTSLATFDAFICALTALLADQGACAKVPHPFPAHSGWVHYPQRERQ
jgi:hypothetical protein